MLIRYFFFFVLNTVTIISIIFESGKTQIPCCKLYTHNWHKIQFILTEYIAELQIDNLPSLLIGKSGRLYIRVVGCSVITVATVLMLLWPLKMLKLSKL